MEFTTGDYNIKMTLFIGAVVTKKYKIIDGSIVFVKILKKYDPTS